MISQGTRKLFRDNSSASKSNQRTAEIATQMQSDDSDEERELTNLNWLLRNQNLTWPKTIETHIDDELAQNIDLTAVSISDKSEHSPSPRRSPQLKSNQLNQICNARQNTPKKHAPQSIVNTFLTEPRKPLIRADPTPLPAKRPSPAERYDIFIGKVKRDLVEYEKLATKYETDVTEKPPFNYSHIIGMAMLENGRVTLQQICAWIESKFAFFRVRKKWNNSIRHNLSLHHCFRNRKREEKGKGGYWELGVDPKKCDRKRIRNRKSAHSKQNHKVEKKIHSPGHYSHLIIPPLCEHQSSQTTVDQNTNTGIYVDESNHTLKSTVSRTYLHAQGHNQDDESVQLRYRKCSQMVECKELIDTVPVQHEAQSFTLTEVGLDLGLSLSSVPSPQMSDDASNALGSAVMQMTTITNDGICLQQQYGLGTIIISTTGIIEEASGLNCLITDKYGCASMICKDDELPSSLPGDSSFSTVLTSTLDNAPSESHKNQDITLITTAESSPVHPSNITINCDYTNFRPFMDSIDEPFHYLHSGAEINRADEILDNLLDVCVTHY
ncbi:uncharacterized protein LOC6651165 [Drosophila willistoni]|uniref:uncharacterized protein LOC6651165 n=1 Tax=Drosophila willistoni TaxID=7260 RepID=UPI000C26CDBE|nr:uncharacterized protein LOC6651165 [Drosophila willistoni]